MAERDGERRWLVLPEELDRLYDLGRLALAWLGVWFAILASRLGAALLLPMGVAFSLACGAGLRARTRSREIDALIKHVRSETPARAARVGLPSWGCHVT